MHWSSTPACWVAPPGQRLLCFQLCDHLQRAHDAQPSSHSNSRALSQLTAVNKEDLFNVDPTGHVTQTDLLFICSTCHHQHKATCQIHLCANTQWTTCGHILWNNPWMWHHVWCWRCCKCSCKSLSLFYHKTLLITYIVARNSLSIHFEWRQSNPTIFFSTIIAPLLNISNQIRTSIWLGLLWTCSISSWSTKRAIILSGELQSCCLSRAGQWGWPGLVLQLVDCWADQCVGWWLSCHLQRDVGQQIWFLSRSNDLMLQSCHESQARKARVLS